MENRKEAISYLIWGIIGVVVNVGLFRVLILVLDYRIAELLTLVLMKIFCYVTNKLFVFKTKCNSAREMLRELCSFMGARLATSIMDIIGLVVMVEMLKLDEFFSKCCMALIVILINYVLSKKFVFVKKKK